jgi:hypothetical protein
MDTHSRPRAEVSSRYKGTSVAKSSRNRRCHQGLSVHWTYPHYGEIGAQLPCCRNDLSLNCLLSFYLRKCSCFIDKRRCGPHRHVISCFSWSCSAEPSQLAPVQLRCETPRMTTRTRPCSPQDGWRDLKWEFLNRFSAASHIPVSHPQRTDDYN